MGTSVSILIVSLIAAALIGWTRRQSWKKPIQPFPTSWKLILSQEVPFYNSLSASESDRFEYKISEFLLNCRITGIETTIDGTNTTLEKIFAHDMSARNLSKQQLEIGRNSPCPCKSGKKFNHCCGREHYR